MPTWPPRKPRCTSSIPTAPASRYCDLMSDYDSGGYDDASGYDAGVPVQFEFVDAPALVGEDVEWSFRTVGGRTAPAGSVGRCFRLKEL